MPLGFGLEITGESNAVASDESGLYWARTSDLLRVMETR